MCVSMCLCVHSHSIGCNGVKLTWQSTPIHTGDTRSCRVTYLHWHQICVFVLPQTKAVLFFHKPSHSSVIVTRVSWLSFVFYNVLDVPYRMHRQLRGSTSIQVSLGVEVESALPGTKARDEWRRWARDLWLIVFVKTSLDRLQRFKHWCNSMCVCVSRPLPHSHTHTTVRKHFQAELSNMLEGYMEV